MAVHQRPNVVAGRGRPGWLTRETFPFESHFVDVNGTAIHYVDEGSGPALLFVSAGFWSFMFRDVILRLRSEFRCLSLDFPGSGLSGPAGAGRSDQSVLANAKILEGFIEALDLQDITMAVHDVGGPIGFRVATDHPDRFRALVITNTFGWPLRDYPTVRRMLGFVASPWFGAVNTNLNLLIGFTATSYGVGRRLTKPARAAFKGPWRSREVRRTTQQVLAGAGRIDPLMAELERGLSTTLADLPVLTLFGRKNDPYGWQQRFGAMFHNVTAAGIEDGNHFPFNDDPDGYSEAITDWWARKVALPNDPPMATRTASRRTA